MIVVIEMNDAMCGSGATAVAEAGRCIGLAVEAYVTHGDDDLEFTKQLCAAASLVRSARACAISSKVLEACRRAEALLARLGP